MISPEKLITLIVPNLRTDLPHDLTGHTLLFLCVLDRIGGPEVGCILVFYTNYFLASKFNYVTNNTNIPIMTFQIEYKFDRQGGQLSILNPKGTTQ